MAVPANILQQVQTYQLSSLAFLQNLNCYIGALSNTKFKDFEKLTGNLGDTVTFDLPPRMTTTNSLIANFQPADQRVQTLTCRQPISTSYAFTAQQFIFNAEQYMERWGKAATKEIGAVIEADVAQVNVTNTFRFFGDGINPINSFTQLANALALFHEFGSASINCQGVLPNTSIPNIVGTGLNQFALDRNNTMANSWELGEFSNCSWYRSNLLPTHIAGSAGNAQSVLTVSAFTQNGPNNSIDSITFTGAPNANDPAAVLQFDKFQFQDGVAGLPNLRFRTFIGHIPSQAPVQFQAIANATSGAGPGNAVTVFINPPLQSNGTNDQNLNVPLQIGMQAIALPSHKAGLIMAGDPLFLAMPRLPDQSPFYTGNEYDPDTAVSIRMTYGAQFGQNSLGMVHDAIWGKTLVPEYAMALIFPL